MRKRKFPKLENIHNDFILFIYFFEIIHNDFTEKGCPTKSLNFQGSRVSTWINMGSRWLRAVWRGKDKPEQIIQGP